MDGYPASVGRLIWSIYFSTGSGTLGFTFLEKMAVLSPLPPASPAKWRESIGSAAAAADI